MRSNVCKIETGTKDLARIFSECDKVAVYNELSRKQAMQLRLLCEELDGLLPEILGDFEGGIWIEVEDDICKVNVSVEFKGFCLEKKQELLALSKNKKNTAVKGLTGKIRSVLEDLFLDEDVCREITSPCSSYYLDTEAMDYAYLWTLEQYRCSAASEEKKQAWDELEKSVIASVADDVLVGVKGKRADVILVKDFSKGEDK